MIRNRKHAVLELKERCGAENSNLFQAVVAGAGLAPLGLEWAARHPGSLVSEVDRAQMPLKERLVSEAAPEPACTMRFLAADIKDPVAVRHSLLAGGWPGARVRQRLTMRAIEKRRTGRNVHFHEDADGWIEVCLLEL